MSFAVYLCDPVTKNTIEIDAHHYVRGGTYVTEGTRKLYLNITYNYSPILYEVLEKASNNKYKQGIRSFDGLQSVDTIPVIKKAISMLGDDTCDDYWQATEGNVKKALYGLLSFAKMRPDGIWSIE